MKKTDFANLLGRFFTNYLVNEQGRSHLTVESYRVAIVMYLEFMEEKHQIKPDMFELKDFTKESVEEFLDWLQEEKGATDATRNQKLAAFRSFARYLKEESPEYLDKAQKILEIHTQRLEEKEISYLNADGVKLLIDQVNLRRSNGLRDLVMLTLLCTVGLRVSELTAVKVGDLRLGDSPSLLVHGKGGKKRYVPLTSAIRPHLQEYLKRMRYDLTTHAMEPLFKNHTGEQFNRRGISYVLKKYADKARKVNPSLIPEDLSPNTLRHTAAMEMVTSGKDLDRIKDILGHANVTSTEVYAKADTKQKKSATEETSTQQLSQEPAKREKNQTLKDWLKSLGKN